MRKWEIKYMVSLFLKPLLIIDPCFLFPWCLGFQIPQQGSLADTQTSANQLLAWEFIFPHKHIVNQLSECPTHRRSWVDYNRNKVLLLACLGLSGREANTARAFSVLGIFHRLSHLILVNLWGEKYHPWFPDKERGGFTEIKQFAQGHAESRFGLKSWWLYHSVGLSSFIGHSVELSWMFNKFYLLHRHLMISSTPWWFCSFSGFSRDKGSVMAPSSVSGMFQSLGH